MTSARASIASVAILCLMVNACEVEGGYRPGTAVGDHHPASPNQAAGGAASGGGTAGGTAAGGTAAGGGGSGGGSGGGNGGAGGDGGGPPAGACQFGGELGWTLPTSGFATDQLDDSFEDGSGSCAIGELSIATRDLDGDRRPDLVVADHCDHGGVGTDHWEVYLNHGFGFELQPLLWSLPPNGFGMDQLDDVEFDESGSCLVGELSVATMDMDGDLRPDLVVADHCDHGGVGTDHWEVYLNHGSGFELQPLLWSLPVNDFGMDQLDDAQFDESGSCMVGELSVATMDMDGDLRPDLVVADHCDHGGVGTDHWEVYLNHGSGFELQPLLWSLPASGFGMDQLDDVQFDESGSCALGELSVATRDMDGDWRPDLVVADHCDHAGVGTDTWWVYRNLGDGFGAAVTRLLPGQQAGFGSWDMLDDLASDDGGLCTVGQLAFVTRDLDGDERPDLVVTDDCDHAGVGTTHWRVFPTACP